MFEHLRGLANLLLMTMALLIGDSYLLDQQTTIGRRIYCFEVAIVNR